MKKIISLLLCAAILLTGCAPVDNTEVQSTNFVSQAESMQNSNDSTDTMTESSIEDVDVDVNKLTELGDQDCYSMLKIASILN